jgi:hypothetical protein
MADIDDVKNLFSLPTVDPTVGALMVNSLDGSNLAGCLGTSLDDIETDDVTVVKILLDASISMKKHEQVVRDSYDKMIQSFKNSKQGGSILVSTVVFSTRTKILHGFKKSDEIAPIGNDYRATGGSTAVYDALMESITGAKAYATDLNQNGVRTKTIVVVFSDGDDNDSQKSSSSEVKITTESLLKKEMFYPVYVGYTDPNDPSADTILKAVAKKVGFPNVLTAAATESEIRRTVDLVSKSVIRTSQTTIGGTTNSFFS